MLCSRPGSTIGFLWVITRQHLKVLIKDNQGCAAGAEAAWTGHGGLGGSPSFISPWDLGNRWCCCLILWLCGSQGKAAASDLGTPRDGAGEGATGTREAWQHGPILALWGGCNMGSWGPCLASSPRVVSPARSGWMLLRRFSSPWAPDSASFWLWPVTTTSTTTATGEHPLRDAARAWGLPAPGPAGEFLPISPPVWVRG